MGLLEEIMRAAVNNIKFKPQTLISNKYKYYCAVLDLRMCLTCLESHGKVYEINETPDPKPLIHPNCRCEIIPLEAIRAGTATQNGYDGAIGGLNIKANCLIIMLQKEKQKRLAGSVENGR